MLYYHYCRVVGRYMRFIFSGKYRSEFIDEMGPDGRLHKLLQYDRDGVKIAARLSAHV